MRHKIEILRNKDHFFLHKNERLRHKNINSFLPNTNLILQEIAWALYFICRGPQAELQIRIFLMALIRMLSSEYQVPFYHMSRK